MDGFTVEVESWEDNEVVFDGDEQSRVLDILEERWTQAEALSIVDEFGWGILISHISDLSDFVPVLMDPVAREVLL
jgi:hypothetical protein